MIRTTVKGVRRRTKPSNLERVPWRPFAVTLFDCDSTLSAVEGIDELATEPDHREAVAALTDSAMAGDVPLEDVYGERLSLLNPTQHQVRSVRNRYKAHAVPDAQAVITALQAAENETWIISGGLAEPILEFATWLGVDHDHVRAVETEFDPFAGNWWEPQRAQARYTAYTKGHLTKTHGKADVIRSSITSPGRKMLVGDGFSDLAAASAVDLFVAFAGVVNRPPVTEAAPVVITSATVAPVLALALGPQAVKDMIGGPHDQVARACWDAIDGGCLTFNDRDLAARFDSSF